MSVVFGPGVTISGGSMGGVRTWSPLAFSCWHGGNGGLYGCGTISVPGLTLGTAYTFTVKATNSIGTGSASGASNSITPLTVFHGFNTPALMNGSTTYAVMNSVAVNSAGLFVAVGYNLPGYPDYATSN
jgi:hypothetical protein